MSGQVIPFDAQLRLSSLEQELVDTLRRSQDPDAIVAAVRRAAGLETADQVWMVVQRLSQGPRRTFWKKQAGSHHSYEGRVFLSIEEVLQKAVAELGPLGAGAVPELIYEPNQYGPGDCYVRRGPSSRVEINGLPAWMQREWCARSGGQ